MIGLIAMALAWPLSYVRGDRGLAIGHEDGSGKWDVFFDCTITWATSAYVGVDEGTFKAFYEKNIPNPKPVPVPTGGAVTFYAADISHWLGLRGKEIGIGTFSTGKPWDAAWISCTGIMFPIWPISILSAASLFWILQQRRRKQRLVSLGACSHCSYDLRAHQPGDKCPECGTTIPINPAKF
jgi:hypothetical protein